MEFLTFINKEVTVLLLSMLPIIELRGGIPMGIAMELGTLNSFLMAFLGSLIPVPFLLFGTRHIVRELRKIDFFDKFLNSYVDKTLRKSKYVKKYGFWGLVVFVAIPFPGMGVWSGTFVAFLLDLRFKLAFPAIAIGNFIAGILILAGTQLVFLTF